MPTHQAIKFWVDDLSERARSGELGKAIGSSFGIADLPPAVTTFLKQLAQGEAVSLPKVVVFDQTQLQGHLGAYSLDTDTIFISAQALTHKSVALEVLTHELGHAIANRHFGESGGAQAAYQFTRALLGQDHALALSSNAGHQHSSGEPLHSDALTLPGTQESVPVQWFDTSLHIDWARAQLPMLNAQAFELLKLGQNDSDAFWGPVRVGVFSPYGLQTDSSTHFDNNNVRGSIEAARKRWSNGIERLDDTAIERKLNLPFVDKALVGPSFEGANAGIENLLYRFGQITHAMQDFYSHSNWIEMVRGMREQWITPDTLLDSSLDLPAQLNPGTRINNAPDVMVAMSGPDYDATVTMAGKHLYLNGLKSVYWWVNDKQNGWGETFAKLKSGAEVGGLMTGAVNSAVYYDTDFSVPLRASDRSGGLIDSEYYRGFSHGGLAGEFIGHWMSPLSKDKPDNGRFNDKSLNRVLFEEAQAYSALQVRNDFDRMGNLIYKSHGIDGLQKFANFAIVEADRELFVNTYSQPGGRWDWGATDVAFAPLMALMPAPEENADEDFHFDESNLRFVEIFYPSETASFTTQDNRAYLTQVNIDGQWLDAAEGLINTHHDHLHDYGPEAFVPAAEQHADRGGRMVYTSTNQDEGHYLGTIYAVSNINTNARVYLNHFDVGMDEVHVVDAHGNLIQAIDVDRADYAQTRQYLLDTYNIKLNARPETEVLRQSLAIRSAEFTAPLILQASDFFSSPDSLHAPSHDPAAGSHIRLSFAGHDETQPWLTLLDDGTLQISDISQVPQGLYEIYVSVADEAGLLEGAMITLAIDPRVSIGSVDYDPTSLAQISFRNPSDAAIGLFAQVVNSLGEPVSFLQNLGVRVGDAAGLPGGYEAGSIITNLADSIDHGQMQFFALDYNTLELIALDIDQTGDNLFSLSHDQQILADLVISDTPESPIHMDEIYVNGFEDVLLGITLNTALTDAVRQTPGNTHTFSVDLTAASESAYRGDFGFIVADLQTGLLIDPGTGLKLEDVTLSADNIRDYSVLSIRAGDNEDPVQQTASFVLDADLNLNNLALFPYYQVDTHQGSQLFMGGAGAQRDGVSHIVRVAKNTFGIEDLIGADYDFDDIVVTVNAITVTDFV